MFNNEIYTQSDEVSLGSLLGNVLAYIILTELKKKKAVCGTIKFYKHYVDDTLVLIKPSNNQAVLTKFNKFDKNLKFTVDKFPTNTHFSSFEPFQRKTAWVKRVAPKYFLTTKLKQLNLSYLGMAILTESKIFLSTNLMQIQLSTVNL